jgi:hypothetical protein
MGSASLGAHTRRDTAPLARSPTAPVTGHFRRASRLRRVLAHTCRQGDNDGMASDDSKAPSPYRWSLMLLLDGGRPSGTLGWVSAVAPVVTQAAAGAGHWAAGRRQRALAEWAGAAGFGLVAWGLGTEAQTPAEVQESIRQQIDLMRKPGIQVPATAGTETPAARRLSRYFRRSEVVSPVAWMVIGVPWRLRHPRRLTVSRSPRKPRTPCIASSGRPGPCSGAGRGSPPAQPWSQPDR